MSPCFTRHQLRRLRNEIPWKPLLQQLAWPHKYRDRQLAFLCPLCHEYRSAVNPRTNLGRCFHCQTNFNPIDLTIVVLDCDFLTAIDYLFPLLPPDETRTAPR